MTLKQLFANGFRIFRVQKYNENLKNRKGYFVAEYSGKQFSFFTGPYDSKQAANSHIEKICKVNEKALNAADLVDLQNPRTKKFIMVNKTRENNEGNICRNAQ